MASPSPHPFGSTTLVLVSKSLRRAGSGGVGGYSGGQFIPAKLWKAERAKAESALPGLLADFGQEMQYHRAVYEQNARLHAVPGLAAHLAEGGTTLVPLSDVEGQIQVTIRNYYARAFVLGKKAGGNLLGASASDLETLTALRTDEHQYLAGFLASIRAGSGAMPYQERIDWYVQAAREVFWLGWSLATDRADTPDIEWVMGQAEHCEDCKRLAGRYSRAEWAARVRGTGLVPQSGKLACRGYHCKCRLREVDA